jgi:hypothetical protein
MARGFESKSVADQQESALDGAPARREVGDPAAILKRKRLELARSDIMHQMELAKAEGHKVMLRRALEALDKELGGLP